MRQVLNKFQCLYRMKVRDYSVRLENMFEHFFFGTLSIRPRNNFSTKMKVNFVLIM